MNNTKQVKRQKGKLTTAGTVRRNLGNLVIFVLLFHQYGAMKKNEI